MNCPVHPEAEATGFCRNCGKPLCAQCVRDVQGVFYCEPCLATMLARPHVAAKPTPRRSPWAAFFLGFIPGLGAVYNAEYTKAMVHVVIFIGLVTLDSTGAGQPLYGLVTGFFCVYMPVEAFLTARRIAEGSQPTEPSTAPAPAPADTVTPAESIEAAKPEARPSHFPVTAIILIAIGAAFLLDTLGWVDMDRVLDVGWPILLIGIGAYLLWKRTRRTAT